MKAKKFDSDFDQGKDITGSLDLPKARRIPGLYFLSTKADGEYCGD